MCFSIIIPAYNEAEELPVTLAAVRSAAARTAERCEIIVVDNNSSDDTAAIARAHGADRVVFEPFNQIARARNAGAAASGGRFLVFIDADTRISGRLLAESIRILKAGTHVGGGSVIEFEGNPGAVGRLGIRLWRLVSKLTRTAAGSYLFCLREAFEAVGGFDEKLYASEEVRLSRRLKGWAKPRGLRFAILESAPARTSARKLEWHGGRKTLGQVFFMILVPVAVRSRRLCGFWYKRPTSGG
ncbi:MAG: glycosyltransferase [Opitutales bacterium]